MKKLLLIILSIFIFSCNDPVFYSISMEELPLDPRIAGPSTNFAGINNKMYVAARRTIYCYDSEGYENENYKIGQWSKYPVSGRITHLAAINNKLYALAENRIIRFSDTITEEASFTIANQTIHGIFAAEDILFISTSNMEIYYLPEGEAAPLQIIGGEFSILCGVASDNLNYYLCNTTDKSKTENDGIFLMPKGNMGNVTLVPESTNKEFTGIINLSSGSIAAMSRGGRLFSVTSAEVKEERRFSDSRKATSALCVWSNDEYSLLLVGRQDLTNSTTTGYTHGYVEIEFDAGTGALIGESFREPGRTAASSISQDTNEHYASSIGKRGVNYFYQAKDGILFASLNHGVWSYRDRSAGKFTWNAEE